MKIIKDEVTELKEKYGDERRTKVVSRALESVSDEDLIPEEEAIVTVCAWRVYQALAAGYIQSADAGAEKA